MDPEILLQTHAEVAVALLGFTGVVAALGRPLSVIARQRFFSLLMLSLIQVLGCLFPLWFLQLIESPSVAWRVLSGILLGLSSARMWLILRQVFAIGKEARYILNPVVTWLMWRAGFLVSVPLLLNMIGIGFSPNFHLYYAGLLASLLVGFVLFADVVTREW